MMDALAWTLLDAWLRLLLVLASKRLTAAPQRGPRSNERRQNSGGKPLRYHLGVHSVALGASRRDPASASDGVLRVQPRWGSRGQLPAGLLAVACLLSSPFGCSRGKPPSPAPRDKE